MLLGAFVVLTDRGRPIVCDAGPIIHLDELDALDLLDGFGDALIPSAICQEVERHRPTALTRFPFPFERREPQSVGGEPLVAILQRVGLATADQQALLLARETPGSLLLTDDAGIRLVADQLGIAVRAQLASSCDLFAVERAPPVRSSTCLKRSLFNQASSFDHPSFRTSSRWFGRKQNGRSSLATRSSLIPQQGSWQSVSELLPDLTCS